MDHANARSTAAAGGEEDEARRLRALYRWAPVGVAFVRSEDGEIVASNPALEALLGVESEGLVGRPLAEIEGQAREGEDAGEAGRWLGRLGEGDLWQAVQPCRRLEGRAVWVRLTLRRIPAAERVEEGGEVLAVFQDLGSAHWAEEELHSRRAPVVLRERIALVAHEIRNALGGIESGVGVLEQLEASPEVRGAVAEEARARLKGLRRVVDDVLLHARMPRPKPRCVRVRTVLERTIGRQLAGTTENGVSVDVVGDDPLAQADPELLEFVFQNLLQNAAEAMGGRGRIEVRLGLESGMCRVEVVDEGPGVAEDVASRAFQPFFTTRERGSGLGLTVVRRIIEEHGGAAELASEAGGGAVARLWVPRARDGEGSPEERSGAQPP